MRRTILFLLLASACLNAGSKKPIPPASARGENQDIMLDVTLYVDPDSIKQLIGSDLEGHYIVAQVKVEPKYGKEIAIDRDDFTLKTDKDGEHTKPFAPTQIAGRGSLVVRQVAGGGGVQGENGGPMIGMGGPMGGPFGYPGSGGAIGNGGSGDVGSAEAKADNGTGQKENPILKVLRDKALPEKKSEAAVSGLLYFPMEKQKMKDLQIWYGAKNDRITLHFK